VKSIPGKIYSQYVIEVVMVTHIMVQLLTALDVKLQRFKFAILFMIADVRWVRKQELSDAKT